MVELRPGFQTAVFPKIAGALGRLAAMLLKLNGVIASTNPSNGRISVLFFTLLGRQEVGTCRGIHAHNGS